MRLGPFTSAPNNSETNSKQGDSTLFYVPTYSETQGNIFSSPMLQAFLLVLEGDEVKRLKNLLPLHSTDSQY